MSNLVDFPWLLTSSGQIHTGRVISLTDSVHVQFGSPSTECIPCQLIYQGRQSMELALGDLVLVWVGSRTDQREGVVLGRIGNYHPAKARFGNPGCLEAKSSRVVIEGDEDIVIKNKNAKIVLGADGDIEIVCASFTSRCQRVLKLFAPFIKFN